MALTLLGMTNSQAASVSFFDGTFEEANWSSQKFLDGNATDFQVATGGNPGSFRETVLSDLNNGQFIIVVELSEPSVYDPSTQGAITSIDFAFDLKFLGGSAGTSIVGYRLALKQNDSLFYSRDFDPNDPALLLGVAMGPGDGAPSAAWEHFAFSGVTVAEFSRQSGSATLDFSAGGAPITFGFLAVTGVDRDNTSTQSGIDNWEVTVNTVVPIPATSLLAGSGLLGLLPFGRRRRVTAAKR
jgi:hypothetical protein